jgi:hypothetical protein
LGHLNERSQPGVLHVENETGLNSSLSTKNELMSILKKENAVDNEDQMKSCSARQRNKERMMISWRLKMRIDR